MPNTPVDVKTIPPVSVRRRSRRLTLVLLAGLAACVGGCVALHGGSRSVAGTSAGDAQFLDDVEHRTFTWFWERANPENGLVPDRWPTPSFSSVAAIGFGLTAYGVGAEHGWVTREQARDRTRTTLRFLWQAPSGPEPRGRTTYRGFFYHFLDMKTGERFQTVELSTIDTALLMGGVLFAQSYFDRDDPAEREIRALADSLYRRVEWPFFDIDQRGFSMSWRPEDGPGFNATRWTGLDESLLLHVLAVGSPTHPASPQVVQWYRSNYAWSRFQGQEYFEFAPLFGHQYSQIFLDLKGLQDDSTSARGIDYFENSARATRANRAYAMANPGGWRGYSGVLWGLSACDGPKDTTMTVDGRERTFISYAARGASLTDTRDDGTLTPTAPGGSVPFAPDIAIPALRAMRERYPDELYTRYGFLDAFNPTFDVDVKPMLGRVVRAKGWFDTDYLGIDQGPILLMIENHRSGLVWKTLRRNPHVVRGLQRAGFRGGWLDSTSR